MIEESTVVKAQTIPDESPGLRRKLWMLCFLLGAAFINFSHAFIF